MSSRSVESMNLQSIDYIEWQDDDDDNGYDDDNDNDDDIDDDNDDDDDDENYVSYENYTGGWW